LISGHYLFQLIHNFGPKKPQLLHQEPDVMAGTAEHSMQRIAQGAFQRIPIQLILPSFSPY